MEVLNNDRKPKATISGSYGFGWQQMKKNFLYFFLILLIVAIVESPATVIKDSELDNSAILLLLQLFSAAYALLFLPVINYGGNLLYLRGIRNEELDFSELFVGFKEKYVHIILANLLHLTLIGMGLILLIVPGIILLCRLAFVSLLVMDKNLDPIAAIEKSWQMTRGHGWRIFGMGLLAIPVFIAGLLCFIVGAVVAVMWISSAFTALYHAIDLEDQKKLI